MAEAIGIDSHIDTVQRVMMGDDLSKRHDAGHVDIPRLREGEMHAAFFALWVPVFFRGAEAVRRTLDLRDAMQSVLDRNADQIELATTASDIERIVKAHKIAAFLAIEGGHSIDDDLHVLRTYYRLGVRSMTLTHARNTNWADSASDTPTNNGLTDFGKDVVREMNRLGMIVDLAHVSDKTFYDALAVTTKPVIVSHSSMRAISNVPRNVSDEMLRALARNGGVIGINFGMGFINPKDAESLRSATDTEAEAPLLTGRALDEYASENAQQLFGKRATVVATVEDIAEHIDHAVKVVGIDHVGIGSDFDGIAGTANGLEDVSKMPSLIAALLNRGYRENELKKILGQNHLRVIREVTGA
ncbi:MAG TPA: dipeptidase [Candidatus Angelobacter sp.]|nr:dipeptidase [Candidatus Angelobacter sp.]